MTFLHKFTLFFGKKPKNQSHFPINNHSEDNYQGRIDSTCGWIVNGIKNKNIKNDFLVGGYVKSLKTILHGRGAILRPRQMVDIQYDIKIMDGREVSKALKKSKRGILEPLETAYCG